MQVSPQWQVEYLPMVSPAAMVSLISAHADMRVSLERGAFPRDKHGLDRRSTVQVRS